jgi:hypothetical protein
MTDFLMRYGRTCGSLFLERGDERMCRGVRECLDTAREFEAVLVEEQEMGVLSMAETLLRFLDALPDSVIPAQLSEKALRLGESNGSVMQVISFILQFYFRLSHLTTIESWIDCS